MSFKRHAFNTTEHYKNSGLSGKISGINDAIFLRNKYQTELDNANIAFVDMVHYIEEQIRVLDGHYNAIPAIEKYIINLQEKRRDMYASLDTHLKKETDYEYNMWKTTTEGQKGNTINIKQKFKDSDVDEMRYDSMLQYLKKYPEYASKPTFSKLLQIIFNIEQEITQEKGKHNEYISYFNYDLSQFPIYLQKAKDKFYTYNKILIEGNEKIEQTRYYKSISYKFASEETKAMVSINTITHRIEQFKNTLDIIEQKILQYKGSKFVEQK